LKNTTTTWKIDKGENKMYEFLITNLANGQERAVYGYDYNNAMRKAKLNPNEWVMWSREYID
jgi:hypothetical protein